MCILCVSCNAIHVSNLKVDNYTNCYLYTIKFIRFIHKNKM